MWRHRAVGFRTAELQETPLDGLRAGRDGGPGGVKLMGGLFHTAWRFFVVGLAQALVHAAHQCLKPCMCSVCRTPGAGAVPLGTVPLSAGRACPPRGASSARRETKSTRVPSHHCDLASALVFWFRWRITRAARVSRIAAQGTPSICMRRPSRPQGLGRIRLWLSNAR